MNSRSEWISTRGSRREQNVNGTQESTDPPPTIDVDVIEDDDDDVIELTASDFQRAKRHKPNDAKSDGISFTRVSLNRARLRLNVDCVELSNNPIKPREEPKFSCPICLCPFTEEVSTKCGHIFCNKCIRIAISRKAICPTCRKRVYAKGLIRVYLPNTR